MSLLLSLAGRNAKIYLRDKTSVFFSLLSVFIIIGLYALFLAETQVNSIKNAIGDAEGIRFLVDSWIMSGILVVNSVTVTLGVMGTMIDDRARKRLNGFLVAPIRRGSLVWGYLISSWMVGIILCLVGLVLAEIYIVMGGGELLTGLAILKTIGLVALNVVSASSLLFFVMTFMRTPGGFGTFSTILGTIIGFLTGIYVPIGVLPQGVQTVIKCVPFSHSAALMRQIFMEKPLSRVFAGAPAEAMEQYMTAFGVKMAIGSYETNAVMVVVILAATGLLFFLLSAVRMKLRREK